MERIAFYLPAGGEAEKDKCLGVERMGTAVMDKQAVENVIPNIAEYDIESIKIMIEMADSFKEADVVVREYVGSDDAIVKLNFLLKNYSLAFAGSGGDKSDATILYEVVLKTIIGRKWR